ncbi:MAG: stage III sporulation protein AE [Oscillospiraceae bacterium]|nr:stage III sporulation protein AE [Oscillospiraceae bacterium]
MKMKRMVKYIFPLFAALGMIFLSGAQVYGAENDLAAEFGADRAGDGLSYEAADFLAENNITPDSTEGVMALSPKTVIAYMWEKLKNSAVAPLKLAGMVFAIVIMSGASYAAADAVNTPGGLKICRTVTVLTAVTIVIPKMESCINSVTTTLSSGGDFMLSYVPVFAGICAASGNVGASAAYSGILLAAAEFAVRAAEKIIMPAASICMAMHIIDAVNPDFSLSSLTGLIKKWCSLLMGFMMTIFTGLLSLQSLVGTAADTVGIKAAKFMVSNFVPVVGGAVAEAYSTMRSGLGMLKGAAGAFGIIALLTVLLPPVLETFCMYLVMTAGQAAAELFGQSELAGFFGGAASVLSITAAVIACFGVLFIVSTLIMMAVGV